MSMKLRTFLFILFTSTELTTEPALLWLVMDMFLLFLFNVKHFYELRLDDILCVK